MPHHLRVRLFPKMKMWRKNVLEQMNQEITDQHKQKRALSANSHRLRNHVGKRHSQHVPRAQRHEIVQEMPRPIPPNHKQAAQQIPRRGHHPKPRRHPHPRWKFVSQFPLFLYLITSLLHYFIRCVEIKSHRLPAPRNPAPPAAPAPSPSPPPRSPPPASHSTAPLPHE